MKFKITLLALMIASLGAHAQTDVTKYFLQNYGFDSDFNYPASSTANVAQEILEIPGWTPDFIMNYTITGVYEFGFKGTFNGGTVPEKGYDGEAGGGLALSTGWSENMAYYQTVTLPAGDYTIKVPTYNGKSVTAGFSLLAWSPGVGTDVESTVNSYPAKQWTLDQISFTLKETTSGNIVIGYKAGVNNKSEYSANLVIDYVQILASNMAVDKTELKATIDEANGQYGDGSGNEADVLMAAITKAQAVYDNADVDMVTVLEENLALKDAITAYRKANLSEKNPQDCTSYIVNPSFEDGNKGWTNTNLAAQTNTSFSKKAGTTYMEKWVSSGSAGSASIIQTLKNLPVGKYKLTVAAQNLTQSSTSKKNTGAYIYVNDLKETVYTPNDYSVKFNNITGEPEIGFVAENATGNYLAVDNFRLYLIGYMTYEEIDGELGRLVSLAESLQADMMSTSAANGLSSAISAAEEVLTGAKDFNTNVALTLNTAIAKATESIKEYQNLQAAIDDAESVYDEAKEGALDLLSELSKAKYMMTNGDATSNDITNEIEALASAKLVFLVANGTGTEPKVTTKTDFMIPAAHGGLIRATITGTGIKERGICWSTEPEPTIGDHRETTYYNQKGLLFHVQGMEPASVYYARAYAITNTYAVGYGDVIKVVTLPNGSCVGTWDNGAPTEAANERCRKAIQETMDYLNEWTAIKGFTLSGHYGAQTPTADCSYGGYMRIGPNAGNQAIGTVIHETGHGVGVGTHWRWNNCADNRANTTHGKWLGRWANETLHFLENTTDEAVFMTGDGVHGWGTGPGISYDWFVNGADKDKHLPVQYIGGCALLYSLYVDGLCPTSGYANGVPGYTFFFDENTKYCIKCADEERGLNDGFLSQTRIASTVGWKKIESQEELVDEAQWYLEFVPSSGHYRFKNAATGNYLTHTASASAMSLKGTKTPGTLQNFQLMPGRNKVSYKVGETSFTDYDYWFSWTESSTNKSMGFNAFSEVLGYGSTKIEDFNYSDKGGTKQRYIIIPADQVKEALPATPDAIGSVNIDNDHVGNAEIYGISGIRQNTMQKGMNIIRTANGKVKKVYVK